MTDHSPFRLILDTTEMRERGEMVCKLLSKMDVNSCVLMNNIEYLYKGNKQLPVAKGPKARRGQMPKRCLLAPKDAYCYFYRTRVIAINPN